MIAIILCTVAFPYSICSNVNKEPLVQIQLYKIIRCVFTIGIFVKRIVKSKKKKTQLIPTQCLFYNIRPVNL